MSTTGWVVLGIVVVLVIWAISIYNSLVAMRQRTNQAFADIDVQLKQRHDLIPNLIETVKGYAAHERGTLEAVVQARNAAMAAPGVEQKVAAENVLSGALRQLFALSENYPNLKANANFQQLQTDLSDIENKLAASRRFFNNAVQEYNTGIQQFPGVALRRNVRLLAAHVFRSRREPRPARAGAEREVLDSLTTPSCPARAGRPRLPRLDGRDSPRDAVETKDIMAAYGLYSSHPVEQAPLGRAADRPVLSGLCDGVCRRAAGRSADRSTPRSTI